MRKLLVSLFLFYSVLSIAQVKNDAELNFPQEGAIPEGIWGSYLIGDNGVSRTLRIGVSNDSYTRAEIELENNNTPSGKIVFKTTNSNSTLGALPRMVIGNDGNVGIGTLIPKDNVEISHANGGVLRLSSSATHATIGSNAGIIKFYKSDASVGGDGVVSYIRSRAYDLGGSYCLDFATGDVAGGNPIATRMSISHVGNVGIGTIVPKDNLEILHANGGVLRLSSSATHATIGSNAGIIKFYKSDASVGGDGVVSYIRSRAYDLGGSYCLDFATGDVAGGNPIATRMSISHKGNVGIGTTSPYYKLDVAGTIRAHEVKVNLNTGGADFVFEEDYNLRSLEEVESFVKENKHLPEIAKASEMEEEGLNMAEFQIQLLQKIEELTLYIIEQEKRIKELENQK